jgi:hypothetical protein
MTKEERKLRVAYAYKMISTSSVHQTFKERLKIFFGWSPMQISAKLRKVAAYMVDNPDANLAAVYAGAFGIRLSNGTIPEDVTK